MYIYNAEVSRIVDGDTRDLNIDVWFYMTAKIRVRLARVDTPELRWKDKKQWNIVAEACREKYLWKTVKITTSKMWKWRRRIAEIEYNWENVSSRLLSNWMAKEVN